MSENAYAVTRGNSRRDVITVRDPDQVDIVVHRWRPARAAALAGAVHILHGWADHARRYDGLGSLLADHGYLVHADDHRGHGQTGLSAPNGLGDLGPRGMNGVVGAVRAVTKRLRSDAGGVPLFLIGHSWGAVIAQRLIRHPDAGLRGCVMSGSTYAPGLSRKPGNPNEAFPDARTPHDWLCSKPEVVSAYLDDPLCGFSPYPAKGWVALLAGRDENIPPGLSVLILNGSEDPIGGTEGGTRLARHYREVGIRDVTFRSFEGARHEILLDTCGLQACQQILDWLIQRSTAGSTTHRE